MISPIIQPYLKQTGKQLWQMGGTHPLHTYNTQTNRDMQDIAKTASHLSFVEKPLNGGNGLKSLYVSPAFTSLLICYFRRRQEVILCWLLWNSLFFADFFSSRIVDSRIFDVLWFSWNIRWGGEVKTWNLKSIFQQHLTFCNFLKHCELSLSSRKVY